jgi:hypothetical protein
MPMQRSNQGLHIHICRAALPLADVPKKRRFSFIHSFILSKKKRERERGEREKERKGQVLRAYYLVALQWKVNTSEKMHIFICKSNGKIKLQHTCGL